MNLFTCIGVMSSLLFPETPTIGQHEAQLMFQGTNTCIVESCVKHHNHNPPPLLCRERINHILINNHKINSYTSLLITYFVIKYMNRVEELALPIQTLTYRIEGQIDCLYKLEYLY